LSCFFLNLSFVIFCTCELLVSYGNLLCKIRFFALFSSGSVALDYNRYSKFSRVYSSVASKVCEKYVKTWRFGWCYLRVCPLPSITCFVVVKCCMLIGPRACSFCVLIPISVPKPNWLPSVKRVLAFQ